MEHPENTAFGRSHPVAASLGTGDYVRLLHPLDAFGKPSLVWKDGRGDVHCRTYDLKAAPTWAEFGLEGDVYVTLHRFHGPRGIERLAALNGLFLDLDVDRLPADNSHDPLFWSLDVEMHIHALGLPDPTVLLSTGRGLAVIWLVDPLPPKAMPRWQAAQNALIDLFKSRGADPRCRDVSRITRLPGSTNSKNGKEAKVLTGSLLRYDFDGLADAIYIAAGRPTRAQLRERQAKKEKKQGGPPRGLPPRARFEAVQRDLDKFRDHVGGTIPRGIRNTWLHLYATCLSHTRDPEDVGNMVFEMAAVATPDLPASEVKAISKQAAGHAALPTAATPLSDGRYHYSGATAAEALGVTADTARLLDLRQIMPAEERARRKAERQAQRRREAGIADRREWLEDHAQESRRPWDALGISRATYFRRKRDGKLGLEHDAL
jgi:hypothetical protein